MSSPEEEAETIAQITRCAIHQSDPREKSSGESLASAAARLTDQSEVRLDTFPAESVVAEGSIWRDPNSNRLYVSQHGIWRRSDQLCECCGVVLSSPEDGS